MNGVPMKIDYSKTINEQLPTFNYYKDRYVSYELELIKLRKENQKYKEVIDKAIKRLEEGITFCKNDSQGLYDICNISIQREEKILDFLKEVE